MKVKDAASMGFVFVIIHLVMHVVLSLINIVSMLPAMGHGVNIRFLFTTILYMVSAIILDIAILMVFGSLARSKEQLVKDEPGY